MTISETQRFMYHSFPRRQDDNLDDRKGLVVLELIARFGLLLTPEIQKWRDHKIAPSQSDEYIQESIRCCFTELSENEVGQHARYFGNYALEFEHKVLCDLGAMPVFYIPRMSEYEDYGVGPALVTQLAQVGDLVSRIKMLKAFAYDAQNASADADILISRETGGDIKISAKGTNASCLISKSIIERAQRNDPQFRLPDIPPDGGPIGCVSNGLFSLMNMVTWGLPSNTDALMNPIRMLASILYSTERTGDALLSHYQQREWRIIGGVHKSEKPVSHQLAPEHREALLKLDPDFFGREMQFLSGPKILVDACEAYSNTGGGASALSLARRVICPRNRVDEAKHILREFARLDVVSVDSLAT